jgi:serine/threonine protein kinase
LRSFVPRPREVDASKPPSERYRILGRIARGSMAEIHLARMATRSGGWREVVVKFLAPRLKAEKDFVEMFHDEARIASHLVHDNIVQIYELGELNDAVFIAMELVRGVNLAELVRRVRQAKKKIPVPISLAIACGALDALQFAHTFTDLAGWPLKIVHRDICPENILVSYQGQVKLTDFGIARAEGRLHKTSVGQLKGRLLRMAPEQLSGRKVDHRADLFALGGVLYELLVEQHPFPGESELEKLQSVIDGKPNHPRSIDPDMSPDLAGLLLKAIAHEPGDRFQDAASMKSAIERSIGRVATPETMARFVRDLFADKIRLEEQARMNDDDRALVQSMEIFEPIEAPPAPQGPISGASLAREAEKIPPPKALQKLLDDVTEPQPREADLEDDTLTPRRQDTPSEDTLSDTAIADSTSPVTPQRDPFAPTPQVITEEGIVPNTATEPFEPPRRFGRYELVRRIAGGASAEIHLAVQPGGLGFRKKVALKVLDPSISKDRVRIDAFVREAGRVARLSHPSLAQILDLDALDGQYFVAMEYVDGWDLQRIIDRCRALALPIPIPIACRIASEACSGLAAAHAATKEDGAPEPIAHLLLSPSKILVSKQGAVKLIDLGIARALAHRVSSGDTLGRPRYMAPELRSDPPPVDDGLVDLRGDIFSIAAILFEMLTLKPMWLNGGGDDPRLEYSHLREEARRLFRARSGMPPKLEAIVDRASSDLPSDRYPSATSLELELERLITDLGEPVTTQHVASWVRAQFAKPTELEGILRDVDLLD